MNAALSLFSPDGNTPFRKDCATIKHVLEWFRHNNPKRSKSTAAERERFRLYGLLILVHGHRPCLECRPYDLLDFINGHCTANAWTRKRWNATLQTPFNTACKLGLIDKNPFRGLAFPEGKDGRDWTDAEYRALLRESTPCMRRVIVFIRFSGARPGEIRALTRQMVRKEAIVAIENKTAHVNKKPRKIPFNAVIVKLLKWLDRNVPAQCCRLFLNSFGRPWTCKALTKNILAIRRRIKMPDDVKLHGGRHTFATNAIMNGVDVAELMEILGHASLKTTQRYVHLAGKVDHLSEAMERAVRPKAREPR